MTDSAIVKRGEDLKSAALLNVGLLCNMTSQDLVKEHQSSYKLTVLYKTLLGINPEHSCLREHLQSLQRLGTLVELIDEPDSCSRSPLV